MEMLANIYGNGAISPIVKIKENISVWTKGKWEHYNVPFIEPLPFSSPMVVEMITASGATTLAASGVINKRLPAILAVNDYELYHLRFRPLDDVEGILWEQPSTGRFVGRAVHARVTVFTDAYDPYWAMTTFYIIGRDRDMNLEVRNPSAAYATPLARFAFWGYRYVLEQAPENYKQLSADVKNKLDRGDRDAVREVVGATCWLPAEGR